MLIHGSVSVDVREGSVVYAMLHEGVHGFIEVARVSEDIAWDKPGVEGVVILCPSRPSLEGSRDWCHHFNVLKVLKERGAQGLGDAFSKAALIAYERRRARSKEESS